MNAELGITAILENNEKINVENEKYENPHMKLLIQNRKELDNVGDFVKNVICLLKKKIKFLTAQK